MHYGSKGWYVEELKKLGMTKYEGRKLQSYKKHFWPTCLKASKINMLKPCSFSDTACFYALSSFKNELLQLSDSASTSRIFRMAG